MDKAPKVGDRDRYAGSVAIGPCTGTVVRVYQEYTYPEDFDWESDENPRPTGLAPESEWHVAVKVDERPTEWPYGTYDKFAPSVADVELIGASARAAESEDA